MGKCVEILIQYLATKRNLHSQFVLALQWCRFAQPNAASTATNVTVPLNRQQIDSLFDKILQHFIVAAGTHVQLSSRSASKSKAFGEFFLNIYELFNAGEMTLRQPAYFPNYSKIMIICYRLLNNTNNHHSNGADGGGNGAGTNVDSNELQLVLNYGAEKLKEKTQKPAKKPPNKDTPPAQGDN